MTVSNYFPSDLYSINKIIHNTQIIHVKEIIIATLREYFSQDTTYHYVKDEWGNPKVIDVTDLNLNAGINDEETTRIWIGQENKLEPRFLPSVIVKHNGGSYKPISFNQDRFSVKHTKRLFQDGYGNSQVISVPEYYFFSGAWDINVEIDVETESPVDRSAIVEFISILFQNVALYDLIRQGLFIKNTRIGGESSEDFKNGKIFKQTVSLECRGEYRRIIPIENLIDIINVCIDFSNVIPPTGHYSENLRINIQLSLLDLLYDV